MNRKPKAIEGEWISADRYLPRTVHLPVELEYNDGHREKKKDSAEGDYRQVKRWRRLK